MAYTSLYDRSTWHSTAPTTRSELPEQDELTSRERSERTSSSARSSPPSRSRKSPKALRTTLRTNFREFPLCEVRLRSTSFGFAVLPEQLGHLLRGQQVEDQAVHD